MILKRWLRLFASRLWILILVALVGGAGGLYLARSGNQSIQPLFEARAVFRFSSSTASERNAPAVAETLAAADAAAKEANATILEQGQATIAADERAGTLTFGARSRDGETARALVENMQMAYLVATQKNLSRASEARIAEIVAEADAILSQLQALAPPGTEPVLEVDPSLQAEIAFLSSQVDGLTQRSNQLAVDRVLAEVGDPDGRDDRVGTPEEIDAELVLIEGRLAELHSEIAELTLGGATAPRTRPAEQTQSSAPAGRQTFEPVEPGSLETAWTIEALQARFEELRVEHQDLLIGSRTTTTPEEGAVAVEVVDLSPEARPVPLTAAMGAVAAVMLALGGIVAHYRLRGPIFVVQDVPESVAGVEMPRAVRSTRHRPGPNRSSGSGWSEIVRRSKLARATKVAAQRQVRSRELRNSAVGSEAPSLVGLSGVGVETREVEAVALDLARALAASDRSVLMVSLDFSSNSSRPAVEVPTVSDLLAAVRRDPASNSIFLKQAMTDAPFVAPRVRMLAAGKLGSDPTDVFVTAAFRTLLERAREQADVVLVVLSSLEQPATELARRRMDGVIAVGRLGKTRRAKLRASTGEGNLVGVVLLTKWPKLGLRRRVESTSPAAPESVWPTPVPSIPSQAPSRAASGRNAASRTGKRFGTYARAMVGSGRTAKRRLRSLNNGVVNGSAKTVYQPYPADESMDLLEIDLNEIDQSSATEPYSMLGSLASDGADPQLSRESRIPDR